MSNFVPLHVHSHYSFLDGYASISDIIERTKEIGANAVGLTDHGNMFAAAKFFFEAKAQGIKPIIGCEVYYTMGSAQEKELDEFGKKYYHLIVYAKDQVGYQNLCRLVSKAWKKENFFYKPRIDFSMLEEFHEGLIVTSACIGGPTIQMLLKADYARAKEETKRFVDLFGDDFYIELQNHGLEEQARTNPILLQMANELGVKTIITNDSHYAYKKDADLQDTLLAISQGALKKDPHRMHFENDEFYIKSYEELKEWFPEDVYEQSFANTQELADKCNVDLETKEHYLPKVEVPAPYTNSKEYFEAICREGIKEIFVGDKVWTDQYEKQLVYELEVIDAMGFNEYFIIVSDFIRWAKSKGIAVGAGRGSAAGSLASYVAKITTLDPLYYGLYFERFLNPERVELPDVDIDIEQERRHEVANYLREKYGVEMVANIATFSIMQAKNSLKDVARTLDVPVYIVNELTSLIPLEYSTKPLTLIYDEVAPFRQMIDTKPELQEVFHYASQLQGTPRNSGVHAAGLVIADRPITDYAPTFEVSDDAHGGTVTVLQFEKKKTEAVGLVKMDLLGLKNLDIVRKAEESANRRHSGLSLDMNHIPFDDAKTYEMLGRGHVEGVFQFDKVAHHMRNMQPESIWDLIALNALNRPGPQEYIPDYIKYKFYPTSVVYDHPSLEPILKETYGIIVYQEQVMRIFQDLAGYSLGRADLIRRAIGKKEQETLERELRVMKEGDPETGVVGMRANGIPDHITDIIIEKIKKFADYAFNKSHSVCYAELAYQTAYLKANYPIDFMAATMTMNIGSDDLKKYISVSAHKMNIPVLPPHINISTTEFVATNEGVRFALSGVDGVGPKAAKQIVHERLTNGDFKDLEDFCFRMNKKGVNKSTIRTLVMAGAFDFTGKSRTNMVGVVDDYTELASEMMGQDYLGTSFLEKLTGQSPSALLTKVHEYAVVEDDPARITVWEKETLDILLTVDPLKDFEHVERISYVRTIEDMQEEYEKGNLPDRSQHLLLAMAGEADLRYSKKGNPYAVVNLESAGSRIEARAFEKTLPLIKNTPFMQGNNLPFLVLVSVLGNSGELSLAINDVIWLENLKDASKEEVQGIIEGKLSPKSLAAIRRSGKHNHGLEEIKKSHHDILVSLDKEWFEREGNPQEKILLCYRTLKQHIRNGGLGRSKVLLATYDGQLFALKNIEIDHSEEILDRVKRLFGTNDVRVV